MDIELQHMRKCLKEERKTDMIDKEADTEMKQAYTEMLEGCLLEPDNRIWYAVWNMELKKSQGTIVGDFCFKGLENDGVVEIGYGVKEKYRHQGYMTEAVKVITEWELSQDNVRIVEAETDVNNIASQQHPIKWEIPTYIFYGEKDNMTSREIIDEFADKTCSSITVMPGGEHWFHTEEQMKFLDNWILESSKKDE